ncbi:putative peptidoglycan binding protein [Streptomyces sp. TLI_55]|uniref:peptidoglycan-binding domain-containing protein n=1 Tax=Streptomyces sp. TLI_55 TaxID=1938861 RepID=UPI000BC8ACB8|nr:peptidoglycan-binding domain-containing protein [Streptomyces sp. TLI_55]SNX64661.1 putative peptidoglycan binding protein [Streptomyces sp. TLI_55]
MGSRTARRRRAVVVVAALAGLLSVGGLAGSRLVRSPSQAAADTRPPAPSVITAPVTRQVLRSTVVLRGTFADGRTVSAQPSSVADTEAPSRPAQLMVTGVFTRVGRSVRAARALVEYSGRPVFALPGAVPAYRDLVHGEQGGDVEQLQKALVSQGYGTGGDTAGVFGPGTEQAVRELYRHLGYPVPVTRDASPPSASDGKATTGADASASPTPTPQDESSSIAHAMVPASEVIFVPSLPARVVSVPVQVGDPVKGPVITLARGGLTLTGQLDPAQAGLVTPGMKVSVLSEATGAQARATVESVGALVTPGDGKAGTSDSGTVAAAGGGAYRPLAVKPDKAWNTAFAGQDVRITVTAAATAKAVLAVPEAAVTAGADTHTSVTVVTAAGARRTVRVTTGASADGLVQVIPARGADLEAGDRVVVGK